MIKAVVFDAFDTLVHITEHRRPFHALIHHALAKTGLTGFDPHDIMRAPMDLDDVAAAFEISPPPAFMARLHEDLALEVASIKPYTETADTLRALKARGLKIGICSNLGEPYAAPVLQNLPFAPNAATWSFEVGATKPQPEIYADICNRLGLEPGECHFIGDTYHADVEGPRAFGMKATHLRRATSHKTGPEAGIPDLGHVLAELG